MKKCTIIYNPQSGKKYNKPFLNEFEGILKDNNYETTIISTEYKGHAKEIALNIEECDLVISIGGDGTFNEVVTGNLKREKPLVLAHIPLGTTNDVGNMFGYGTNPISNLKLLMKGKVRKIDMCILNDNPFVYVAGFGKFMNIPYQTPRNLKKNFGYLAYLIEGCKSFFGKTHLYDIEYEVDGETYRGLYSFIIISNANRIAGIKDFYKDVKLDDNRFEILFCNIRKRLDIIKSFILLKTSDITKVSGFYFHKTDKIKIRFNEKMKRSWCIDGEELESDTNEYVITIKRNVEIMMPDKDSKLFV